MKKNINEKFNAIHAYIMYFMNYWSYDECCYIFDNSNDLMFCQYIWDKWENQCDFRSDLFWCNLDKDCRNKILNRVFEIYSEI